MSVIEERERDPGVWCEETGKLAKPRVSKRRVFGSFLM